MDDKTKPFSAVRLILPNVICEMLTLCTSEERRDLYKGLARISNRGSLGAILNSLYKGSEPIDEKRAASRITTALSIPACVIVNRLLHKR